MPIPQMRYFLLKLVNVLASQKTGCKIQPSKISFFFRGCSILRSRFKLTELNHHACNLISYTSFPGIGSKKMA